MSREKQNQAKDSHITWFWESGPAASGGKAASAFARVGGSLDEIHVADWTLKLFKAPLQQQILVIIVAHLVLKNIMSSALCGLLELVTLLIMSRHLL